MSLKSFRDQLGREVLLQGRPTGIISLVPSQTELLHDLGLEDEVIGITKFCVHPATWRKKKTIIGGTKNLRFEKIYKLAPDLIIANKEENNKVDIEKLEKNFPVWVSDVSGLREALDMIGKIGEICGKQSKSALLAERISESFDSCRDFFSENKNKTFRVVYVIWRSPLMVAGGDTFISAMLREAGYANIFENEKRYPEITSEKLSNCKPDAILLSSEPYPFSQKHVEEFRLLCPSAKVILVDGELFSWYGSRLQHSPAYFRELFIQHFLKNQPRFHEL